MVTGGFRSAAGMADAIASDGVNMIGLARPLCVDPDAPGRLLSGEVTSLERWEDKLRLGPGWFSATSPVPLFRALNGFAVQSWYYKQLRRLGETGRAEPGLRVLNAFIADQRRSRALAKARAPGFVISASASEA